MTELICVHFSVIFYFYSSWFRCQICFLSRIPCTYSLHLHFCWTLSWSSEVIIFLWTGAGYLSMLSHHWLIFKMVLVLTPFQGSWRIKCFLAYKNVKQHTVKGSILIVYFKIYICSYYKDKFALGNRSLVLSLQEEGTYSGGQIFPLQFAFASLCLQVWMWVLTAPHSQSFNSIILEVTIHKAMQFHILSCHPSHATGKT